MKEITVEERRKKIRKNIGACLVAIGLSLVISLAVVPVFFDELTDNVVIVVTAGLYFFFVYLFKRIFHGKVREMVE